jgi:hypothetical protein
LAAEIKERERERVRECSSRIERMLTGGQASMLRFLTIFYLICLKGFFLSKCINIFDFYN